MTTYHGKAPRSGTFNPVLLFTARVISVIFHPLFVTLYVMGFLIYLHPFAYAGFDPHFKNFRFLTVAFSGFFLPLFSVFLVWRLGFIPSMMLRTARDRIIPYIIVMIFYFWIWYVFNNQDNPPAAVHFLLGAFLAICGAWFCNIYFKISMHSLAAGGLLAFIVLFSFNDPYASGLYVTVATLICGLVCTARLMVGNHSTIEVYSGLAVGILAQWIAWQF